MGDVSHASGIPGALWLGLARPNRQFCLDLSSATHGGPPSLEFDVLLGPIGRFSRGLEVPRCHLSAPPCSVGSDVCALHACLSGASIHFSPRPGIFWPVDLLRVPG